MKEKQCPHCGADLVQPVGPTDAVIQIISEFPGREELKQLRPMIGYTGRVLKEELGRVGIDYRSVRITNLWLHAMNKREDCYTFGLQKAIRICQKRRAVLLLGSECAKTFVHKSVLDIAGLRLEEDCDLIKPEVLMCAPNPAIVFSKPAGELKLALQRFAEALESLHLDV